VSPTRLFDPFPKLRVLTLAVRFAPLSFVVKTRRIAGVF
jgi:hypothetical protein